MLFRRPPHPIEAEIPRLRRFALALTRERESADDLVQDCVARALAAWATRRGDDTALRPWL
ncbi:MAG: sigma factor, partial [Ferrovibrio sp.]